MATLEHKILVYQSKAIRNGLPLRYKNKWQNMWQTYANHFIHGTTRKNSMVFTVIIKKDFKVL